MTRSKRSILPPLSAFRFGTLFAILGMDFGMRDVDADASERQVLVFGI